MVDVYSAIDGVDVVDVGDVDANTTTTSATITTTITIADSDDDGANNADRHLIYAYVLFLVIFLLPHTICRYVQAALSIQPLLRTTRRLLILIE